MNCNFDTLYNHYSFYSVPWIHQHFKSCTAHFSTKCFVVLFFRLAFGNECGLAIVDTVQKTCLLNMGTPDLYGKSRKKFF